MDRIEDTMKNKDLGQMAKTMNKHLVELNRIDKVHNTHHAEAFIIKTLEAIQKPFWFMDKWYGSEKHEFWSLKEAKKAAKKQAGSVAIYKGRELVASVAGEGVVQ